MIRECGNELRQALGEFGGEFDVGSSGGIERKTEAPWVRVFAKSMSPTPRDGFYLVMTKLCSAPCWYKRQLDCGVCTPPSESALTYRPLHQ